MNNKQIAQQFKLLATLLELHNENAFKIKSYTNAAFNIEKLPVQLAETPTEQLPNLQGVGTAIATKITELLQTGSFKLLDETLQKTPQGIVEMTKIKGLGAKKIKTIWQNLEIETIGELLYACYENRLITLSGFGEKTQQAIIENIEYLQQNANFFKYAQIHEIGLLIENKLNTQPHLKAARTGNTRRCVQTLQNIEILVHTPNLQNFIQSCQNLSLSLNSTTPYTTYFLQNQFELPTLQATHQQSPAPFIFYINNNMQDFEKQLFITTGSKEHINTCLQKNLPIHAQFETETQLYQSINLPYLIPPLRENIAEWDSIPQLENIIQITDIKGIIHAHSTYSDGANTLLQMAQACIQAGYQYLGISDHSQAAFYANGLTPEKIIQQHAEIDTLNKQLYPFRIFKGIEADILHNGDLDYTPQILQTFDFVIASIHSGLQMNEEKANHRLIKAIENPHTTLLGHPTGRLLLSRKGYPINHHKIIDACAANGVAIELNANPYRLDLDWQYIQYAQQKNVLISINPDAHSIQGIKDVQYGVFAAQKGGLLAQNTLNAKDLKEIEKKFSL